MKSTLTKSVNQQQQQKQFLVLNFPREIQLMMATMLKNYLKPQITKIKKKKIKKKPSLVNVGEIIKKGKSN